MTRKPYYFDATIQRADGEFVPLQCRIVPDVDQDGHCDGVIVQTAIDTRYGSAVELTAAERDMLEVAAIDEQIDRAASRDAFGQLKI